MVSLILIVVVVIVVVVVYFLCCCRSGRYIDLDKVLSVQELSPTQQDKNQATFTVQCDGRTFQLQAHDEPSMRK